MPFVFLFSLYVPFLRSLGVIDFNGLTEEHLASFSCTWWMSRRVGPSVRCLFWQRQVGMHSESDQFLLPRIYIVWGGLDHGRGYLALG